MNIRYIMLLAALAIATQPATSIQASAGKSYAKAWQRDWKTKYDRAQALLDDNAINNAVTIKRLAKELQDTAAKANDRGLYAKASDLIDAVIIYELLFDGQIQAAEKMMQRYKIRGRKALFDYLTPIIAAAKGAPAKKPVMSRPEESKLEEEEMALAEEESRFAAAEEEEKAREAALAEARERDRKRLADLKRAEEEKASEEEKKRLADAARAAAEETKRREAELKIAEAKRKEEEKKAEEARARLSAELEASKALQVARVKGLILAKYPQPFTPTLNRGSRLEQPEEINGNIEMWIGEQIPVGGVAPKDDAVIGAVMTNLRHLYPTLRTLEQIAAEEKKAGVAAGEETPQARKARLKGQILAQFDQKALESAIQAKKHDVQKTYGILDGQIDKDILKKMSDEQIVAKEVLDLSTFYGVLTKGAVSGGGVAGGGVTEEARVARILAISSSQYISHALSPEAGKIRDPMSRGDRDNLLRDFVISNLRKNPSNTDLAIRQAAEDDYAGYFEKQALAARGGAIAGGETEAPKPSAEDTKRRIAIIKAAVIDQFPDFTSAASRAILSKRTPPSSAIPYEPADVTQMLDDYLSLNLAVDPKFDEGLRDRAIAMIKERFGLPTKAEVATGAGGRKVEEKKLAAADAARIEQITQAVLAKYQRPIRDITVASVTYTEQDVLQRIRDTAQRILSADPADDLTITAPAVFNSLQRFYEKQLPLTAEAAAEVQREEQLLAPRIAKIKQAVLAQFEQPFPRTITRQGKSQSQADIEKVIEDSARFNMSKQYPERDLSAVVPEVVKYLGVYYQNQLPLKGAAAAGGAGAEAETKAGAAATAELQRRIQRINQAVLALYDLPFPSGIDAENEAFTDASVKEQILTEIKMRIDTNPSHNDNQIIAYVTGQIKDIYTNPQILTKQEKAAAGGEEKKRAAGEAGAEIERRIAYIKKAVTDQFPDFNSPASQAILAAKKSSVTNLPYTSQNVITLIDHMASTDLPDDPSQDGQRVQTIVASIKTQFGLNTKAEQAGIDAAAELAGLAAERGEEPSADIKKLEEKLHAATGREEAMAAEFALLEAAEEKRSAEVLSELESTASEHVAKIQALRSIIDDIFFVAKTKKARMRLLTLVKNADLVSPNAAEFKLLTDLLGTYRDKGAQAAKDQLVSFTGNLPGFWTPDWVKEGILSGSHVTELANNYVSAAYLKEFKEQPGMIQRRRSEALELLRMASRLDQSMLPAADQKDLLGYLKELDIENDNPPTPERLKFLLSQITGYGIYITKFAEFKAKISELAEQQNLISPTQIAQIKSILKTPPAAAELDKLSGVIGAIQASVKRLAALRHGINEFFKTKAPFTKEYLLDQGHLKIINELLRTAPEPKRVEEIAGQLEEINAYATRVYDLLRSEGAQTIFASTGYNNEAAGIIHDGIKAGKTDKAILKELASRASMLIGSEGGMTPPSLLAIINSAEAAEPFPVVATSTAPAAAGVVAVRDADLLHSNPPEFFALVQRGTGDALQQLQTVARQHTDDKGLQQAVQFMTGLLSARSELATFLASNAVAAQALAADPTVTIRALAGKPLDEKQLAVVRSSAMSQEDLKRLQELVSKERSFAANAAGIITANPQEIRRLFTQYNLPFSEQVLAAAERAERPGPVITEITEVKETKAAEETRLLAQKAADLAAAKDKTTRLGLNKAPKKNFLTKEQSALITELFAKSVPSADRIAVIARQLDDINAYAERVNKLLQTNSAKAIIGSSSEGQVVDIIHGEIAAGKSDKEIVQALVTQATSLYPGRINNFKQDLLPYTKEEEAAGGEEGPGEESIITGPETAEELAAAEKPQPIKREAVRIAMDDIYAHGTNKDKAKLVEFVLAENSGTTATPDPLMEIFAVYQDSGVQKAVEKLHSYTSYNVLPYGNQDAAWLENGKLFDTKADKFIGRLDAKKLLALQQTDLEARRSIALDLWREAIKIDKNLLSPDDQKLLAEDIKTVANLETPTTLDALGAIRERLPILKRNSEALKAARAALGKLDRALLSNLSDDYLKEVNAVLNTVPDPKVVEATVAKIPTYQQYAVQLADLRAQASKLDKNMLPASAKATLATLAKANPNPPTEWIQTEIVGKNYFAQLNADIKALAEARQKVSDLGLTSEMIKAQENRFITSAQAKTIYELTNTVPESQRVAEIAGQLDAIAASAKRVSALLTETEKTNFPLTREMILPIIIKGIEAGNDDETIRKNIKTAQARVQAESAGGSFGGM